VVDKLSNGGDQSIFPENINVNTTVTYEDGCVVTSEINTTFDYSLATSFKVPSLVATGQISSTVATGTPGEFGTTAAGLQIINNSSNGRVSIVPATAGAFDAAQSLQWNEATIRWRALMDFEVVGDFIATKITTSDLVEINKGTALTTDVNTVLSGSQIGQANNVQLKFGVDSGSTWDLDIVDSSNVTVGLIKHNQTGGGSSNGVLNFFPRDNVLSYQLDDLKFGPSAGSFNPNLGAMATSWNIGFIDTMQYANATTHTDGSGTPEAVITAPVGSTFSRTDGGAGTSFYVKESGAGNTGWIAK